MPVVNVIVMAVLVLGFVVSLFDSLNNNTSKGQRLIDLLIVVVTFICIRYMEVVM